MRIVRAASIGAAMMMAAPVYAAEVNVIAAGAVRGIIGGMIDDYAKETGLKFNFTVGPTGQLRDALASGKPVDMVIVSAPLMAEMESGGKIAAGSRVDLGRIGLGIVIRDGAAAPNLSTPEALKHALISAKSIAHTDPKLGGTSTTHLMKVAEGFGIKDQVMAKGVHATGGNDAAAKVAKGEAELAVVLISEIGEAKGAHLAAPLPEALQLWTIYSAAIPTNSAQPDAARAFLAALTGPSMRDRWVKAGWQPVK